MDPDRLTHIPPELLPHPAVVTWHFRTVAADVATARLNILVEVMAGMDPADRPAALTYLRLRFMRGSDA